MHRIKLCHARPLFFFAVLYLAEYRYDTSGKLLSTISTGKLYMRHTA